MCPQTANSGLGVPAKTECYRYVRWEIEDVNGLPRMFPGGLAEATAAAV